MPFRLSFSRPERRSGYDFAVLQQLLGPNSFIFDEEYGPNCFILFDLQSIYRVRKKPAKLNGANAVSTAIVKHVLENIDNFWQVK